MGTYYIFANIYGGHVSLLTKAAQEHGAKLVAVDCLVLEEIPSEERGFREGPGSYLFQLQAETVRAALNKVQNDIIPLAGEQFEAMEEDPPAQDTPGWDEEDLAKIQVAESIAEEGYYSRYGYDDN